ncbi:zinc ribbon domain-containing protein [Leptospira sp. 96542]|nr:zinc ribbon domain-containing protein [Leptospira sp. 96542]
MDFLLVLYSLFFGIILISPFLIFHFRFKETESPFGKEVDPHLKALLEKRNNLLDSLRDVRTDFDSGKLTEDEFQANSIPYIEELEVLESSMQKLKAETVTIFTPKILNHWTCQNCGAEVAIPNAKFCPQCGTSLTA